MYATGAHCELSNLAAELRTMRAEIKAEYEAKRAAEQTRMVDMEKRMMDALKSRQETLLKLLSNKFDVNGVKDNGVIKATLTRGDIAAAVNNALLKEDGPIATLMSRMDTIEQSAGAATTATSTTTATTTEIVPDVGDKGDNGDVQINYNAMLHLWQRDGLFHTVPEGFIFPSCSVATMWNLWFFGNNVTKVCSFRCIKPKDLVEKKQCKVNLSRCKKVMTELINIACRAGMIDSARSINKANGQEVFEYAYNHLLTEVYDKDPSRPSSIKINTIANRIKRR
jgi:hypothetical protein